MLQRSPCSRTGAECDCVTPSSEATVKNRASSVWWVVMIPLLLLMAASTVLGQEDKIDDSMRLSPGDKVSVLLYEGISSTTAPLEIDATVDAEGKIFLPIVGEVVAAGKTGAQLEDDLKKAFGDFVESPLVSVRVLYQRSRIAYLVGAVTNQGAYPVFSGMRVSQFIAESGGINTATADLADTRILRDKGDMVEVIQLDLDQVLKGNAPAHDVIVMPGDKIVIPIKGETRLDQAVRVAQFVTLIFQIALFAVVLSQ